LQTFVTPKSQTEERILGKKKVNTEKTEKDHARHNSGGARIVIATTSLDDESNQSCNSDNRKLG